jgi:DNA mismatch repair protein MutL
MLFLFSICYNLFGDIMSKIKVMDELLANKIAAGEVVERCESVVKELVENSIDAKSTEIKIELIEAGTVEIKVTDNGIGMDENDAVLAFSRHATSKLLDEEDLYRINSLGFRGEALPSIASVSEVTLKTSTGDIGTLVNINGGKIVNVEKADARKGTIIAIKNLFYNTPARLKHLKSLYAELAVIVDYVNKVALSHPEIKFTLYNNGKKLLNTDGSNNLLKVIKEVHGIDIAKKMIEIHNSNDDYIIDGYISYPEITKSNRNSIVNIVNGRIIRNMELNKIINDAYHTYKAEDRYPVIVLNIEVDPTLIDVNIHPTKLDIKFSKMDSLKELIDKSIKEHLESLTLIPSITTHQVESIQYIKPTLELDRVVEEPLFKQEYEVKEEAINYTTNIIESPKDRLPELDPVALVHGTYIVCQNDLGMYLIDQHAAKERINYEKYLYELGHPNTNKTDMLIPLTIEMPTNEYIILRENLNILRNLNFEIEEMGINTFIVKAHPIWLPRGYEDQATKKIIDIVISKEDFSTEKFNEKIAITLSCKLAIKANENITLPEMEHLIDDLRKCNNPFSCPHGRPTIIHYSKYELEKLFKRSAN